MLPLTKNKILNIYKDEHIVKQKHTIEDGLGNKASEENEDHKIRTLIQVLIPKGREPSGVCPKCNNRIKQHFERHVRVCKQDLLKC